MQLGPVRHLALVKNSHVAAGPHHSSLQILKLKVNVFVSEQAHPKTVFVFISTLTVPHLDGAVTRVVGVPKFWITYTERIVLSVQQICLIPAIDGSVKSLLQGRTLFAFTGKMLDIVALQQRLKFRIEKPHPLVGM